MKQPIILQAAMMAGYFLIFMVPILSMFLSIPIMFMIERRAKKKNKAELSLGELFLRAYGISIVLIITLLVIIGNILD